MGLLRDIQDLYRLHVEKKARQRTMVKAFSDHRWVLDLAIEGRLALVRYTPREDEAEFFFKWFVVPYLQRVKGTFSRTAPWDQDKGREANRASFVEFLPYDRVLSVMITAPDPDYRDRLEAVLSRVVNESKTGPKLQAIESLPPAPDAVVFQDMSAGKYEPEEE